MRGALPRVRPRGSILVREQTVRAAAWNPIPAAALLGAVATLALAAAVPVHFHPKPNPLGIVSVATVSGYPLQQEMFWLAYGVGLGGLLAWGIARALGRHPVAPRRQAEIEAVAAATLAACLLLPSPLREVAAAAGVGACFWRAATARSDTAPAQAAADESPGAGRAPRVLLALAIVAVALLRPRIWLFSWNVMKGTPDLSLATDDWGFLSELGQHLAWADAMRRGAWPGTDYFSLYGPLMTLGLESAWALVGRSVATATLYFEAVSALGAIAAMALAARHLRRRALALLVPCFALPIRGRYGVGLWGLLFLSYGIASGRALPMIAAGATGGVALFYSQEFGLAFVLCAGVGLAISGNLRTRLAFCGGLLAVVAAVLAWLASGGALGAALRDMVEYPGYVLAGFGKLPFPALVPALPLSPAELLEGKLVLLRLGYATIVTYVVALLLVLRVDRLRPRSLVSDLRRLAGELRSDPQRLGLALTALYGFIAFRSGMGRSEIINLVQASGCAGILLVVAIDRSLGELRAPAARALGAWHLAGLLLFASIGAFFQYSGSVFVRSGMETVAALGSIASGSYAPRGDPEVARLTAWVREQQIPEGEILFLPSHAAYYYLTDHRSPIRFVVGQHMVTDDHRRESLDRLRAHPPHYIVWSPHSLVLDGIDHETYLGPELMRWVREAYTPLRVQDRTTIFERR